jgi:hypothetical protein
VVDPLQLAMDWLSDAVSDVGHGRDPAAVETRTRRPLGQSNAPASPASELLARLRGMGLSGVSHLTLRRTRRVMVSLRSGRLTVHADFAQAPDATLRAIVRFVMSRRRTDRIAAQQTILAYEVSRPSARRRAAPVRPGDAAAIARLRDAHDDFNRVYFGGALRHVPIGVSGRMKTRLGQYTPVQDGVEVAEIAISRRHIRRDSWTDVLHTLLHEMVHQWQDESGLPVDHGVAFRRKAREVGVLPRARRPVCS